MYVGYYFDTPGYSSGGLSPCFNRLTITGMSQSIINNTTTFSWAITVHNVAGSGTRWMYTGLGFWADGGSQFFSTASSGSGDNIWTIGAQRASGTTTIGHNADGTRSVTLALRDMFNGSYSDARWNAFSTSRDGTYAHQASVTLSLPTIPRTSSASLSNNNFNIGDTTIVNINRASSSFTHNITYAFGGYSGTLATGVGASYTWNTSGLASQMFASIPGNQSGTGTLTVTTMSGGTTIGSVNVGFTYKTTTASSPTTGSWSFKDTNATTIAITGSNQRLIAGLSNLEVSLDTAATAKNSATLGTNAYSVSYNGSTQYANGGVAIPKTFNLGTVNGSAVSISVRDSRNYATPLTLTLGTLFNYNAPTVNIPTTLRINPDGTGENVRLEIRGTYSVFPGNYTVTNEITSLRYRFKERATSTWGSWITITPSTNEDGVFTFTGNIAGTFDAETVYDFQVEATDRLQQGANTGSLNSINTTFYIDIDNNIVGICGIPTEPQSNTAYYRGVELNTGGGGGGTSNYEQLTNLPAVNGQTLIGNKSSSELGLAAEVHTHPNATTSTAGFMSAADKTKLNGVAAGATNVTVNNTLTSTSTTEALSANQGKVLNDKFEDYLPESSLVNNLTTSAPGSPLDASQGKALKDYVDDELDTKINANGDIQAIMVVEEFPGSMTNGVLYLKIGG